MIDLQTGKILGGLSGWYQPDEKIWLYDRHRRYHRYMAFSDIPPTFTLAVMPTNIVEELRLWLRTVGFVKHRFIWTVANGTIRRDDFASLNSIQNKEYNGRFSILSF